MRLFWKLFCSTILITVAACSLGGFVLIDGQFRTAMDREVEALYEENDMLRYALGREMRLFQPCSREEAASLAKGITITTGSGTVSFRLSDETGAALVSSGSMPAGGGLLSALEPPPEEPASTAIDIGVEPEPPVIPTAETDWQLRLVSRENPLEAGYVPPELKEISGGLAVDSRILPALERMLSGARAAGMEVLVCSAYRTEDKQRALFEGKVARCMAQSLSAGEAEREAEGWVARPGTSEHQTGLAVDIVARDYQLLDEGQAARPEQQWLMAHCGEYGFILRYPMDKSDRTGVNYEPWHYRYVGGEAARAITEQGLCLEEYLADRE